MSRSAQWPITREYADQMVLSDPAKARESYINLLSAWLTLFDKWKSPQSLSPEAQLAGRSVRDGKPSRSGERPGFAQQRPNPESSSLRKNKPVKNGERAGKAIL